MKCLMKRKVEFCVIPKFVFSSKFRLLSTNLAGASYCTADEFFCDDRCLPVYYKCDGVEQCSDGSDEDNCSRPEPTTPAPPPVSLKNHIFTLTLREAIEGQVGLMIIL